MILAEKYKATGAALKKGMSATLLKKAAFPLIPLFLSLLLPFAAALAAEADKDLALVNGEPVTHADYRRFLLKISPGVASDTVDKEALKGLIRERLILQEAKKSGISVTDDEVDEGIRDFLNRNNMTERQFEEKITAQGMSLREYRKWLKENIIVLAKTIDREVDRKTLVGDAEIADFYQREQALFRTGPERVRVKAIFLRLDDRLSLAEITALKIRCLRLVSELKKGTSFDVLASLYPENTLKAQDGVLGEFRKGDLRPELDRRIALIKEGEISPPLWLKEGVYILKLEKILQDYRTIEDVRPEILRRLFREKREKLYDDWIKALWERSTITIY